MTDSRRNLDLAGLLALAFLPAQLAGQESTPLLLESFDTLAVSALPAGWGTSQRKTPGMNDWGTTVSSAYSAPGAVLATNATLEQWLATPPLDCGGVTPDRVRMMIRRSGTFTARVAVEVSVDSGRAFPHLAGTIPKETGSGSYQAAEFPVPREAAGQASVVFRWRVIPDSTGTSGTFRMDDIRITAATATNAAADSVIINEVMYSPHSGEPEWIEVFNAGSGPSDLKGWSISDASTTSRHLMAGVSTVVDPGGYAIVTSDTVSLMMQRPGIRARLLQAAGFPSLNNSGDWVRIYSASGGCRDSVAYQPAWGGGTGLSLERVDPFGLSMETANWASCVDSSGATPGSVNSMVRRTHDLALLRVHPSQPCSGEGCDVRVTIRNAGLHTASSWSILLGDDLNRDSVADETEIVARMEGGPPLPPGDSLLCTLVWMHPVPGKHSLRAVIVLAEDERQSNNALSASALVPIPPGSVRINEIMYDPLPGMPEFVELINASAFPIDLDGCTLMDEPTPGGSRNEWDLAGAAFRLAPGGCLAVLADSTGPSWFPSLTGFNAGPAVSVDATSLGLNNDGDAIVVKGAEGVALDSIRYVPALHTPDIEDVSGRSLELLSPALAGTGSGSWGTCVDPHGGTPGAKNSISIEAIPSAAVLSASPNPFSPDGDGRDDATVLSFALPMRSALVRLRVFDVRGRLFRELANIVPAAAEGRIAWDGRDDQGRRGRIGIYIAVIEAIDGSGGTVVAAKCAVVVAGRL